MELLAVCVVLNLKIDLELMSQLTRAKEARFGKLFQAGASLSPQCRLGVVKRAKEVRFGKCVSGGPGWVEGTRNTGGSAERRLGIRRLAPVGATGPRRLCRRRVQSHE